MCLHFLQRIVQVLSGKVKRKVTPVSERASFRVSPRGKAIGSEKVHLGHGDSRLMLHRRVVRGEDNRGVLDGEFKINKHSRATPYSSSVHFGERSDSRIAL